MFIHTRSIDVIINGPITVIYYVRIFYYEIVYCTYVLPWKSLCFTKAAIVSYSFDLKNFFFLFEFECVGKCYTYYSFEVNLCWPRMSVVPYSYFKTLGSYLSTISIYNSPLNSHFLLSRSGNSFLKNSISTL